ISSNKPHDQKHLAINKKAPTLYKIGAFKLDIKLIYPNRISRTFDLLIRIGFHLLQQQLDCTLQRWITTFEQFFWQMLDKHVRINAFILDDIIVIQVKYLKVSRSNAASIQLRGITRYPHKDTHRGTTGQFTQILEAEHVWKHIAS